MVLDQNSQVTRTTAAMETMVGNEIVLMVLESGTVYGLGETGSSVWRLLAKHTQVGEVVEALLSEYDAPREVIESDVLELLAELQSCGLIAIA